MYVGSRMGSVNFLKLNIFYLPTVKKSFNRQACNWLEVFRWNIPYLVLGSTSSNTNHHGHC